jgi:hypothetical protein
VFALSKKAASVSARPEPLPKRGVPVNGASNTAALSDGRFSAAGGRSGAEKPAADSPSIERAGSAASASSLCGTLSAALSVRVPSFRDLLPKKGLRAKRAFETKKRSSSGGKRRINRINHNIGRPLTLLETSFLLPKKRAGGRHFRPGEGLIRSSRADYGSSIKDAPPDFNNPSWL